MTIKQCVAVVGRYSLEFEKAVRKRAARHITSFAILSIMTGSVLAQTKFEEDFDDMEKPWTEVAIQLPATPLAQNLFPIFVSATSTQSFAVDAKSLTLGADGVVRYTMVASSPSGAKNVSYEGIRCQSFEKKLYAFGQPDGSWTRSRKDKWEPIRNNAANRQHAALAQDYLCLGLTIAGKQEEMIERIRNKRTLPQ